MRAYDEHGTYTMYFKSHCRCAKCGTYQRLRVSANRAKRLASKQLSHGKRSAYDAGCRCDACRDARRAAYRTEKIRAHARHSGERAA